MRERKGSLREKISVKCNTGMLSDYGYQTVCFKTKTKKSFRIEKENV